jgi:hypothetical protein
LFASCLLLLAGPAVLPAQSAGYQDAVSANPVDYTPHILDGAVHAMTVVGRTAVVGGDFSQISSADGSKTYDHWYLMAFDVVTGAVLPFDGGLDGPVWALAPGPNNSVLVGGAFHTVQDTVSPGLTRLDLATGKISAGFDAWGDGDVRTLAVRGNSAYVGGWFDYVNDQPRKALARIDVRTGALDTTFDANLDAPEIGRAKVEDLAISPSGDRLAVVGALTQALGAQRVQLALFESAARSRGWPTGLPRRRTPGVGGSSTPTCGRSTSPPRATTSSS